MSRWEPNDGTSLTDREIEVLECVSHGYTNAMIGRKLFLSEDTVKSHLRSIRVKLSATDRAHAVRKGFENGLLRGVALGPATLRLMRDSGRDGPLHAALVALGWTPPPEVMSPGELVAPPREEATP